MCVCVCVSPSPLVCAFNQRKSPEVVTSPFSKKLKRIPLDEEVDAGDEVSQIKPTKAGKQAATKKAKSKKVGGARGKAGGMREGSGQYHPFISASLQKRQLYHLSRR